jgi:hypothetical protein
VVKILEYFGIKPATGEAVNMPTCGRTIDLVWAIVFVIISIGLSLYGLYLSARKSRQLSEERGNRIIAEKQLKDAESPLIFAGKIALLADDARWICTELECLMQHGTLASLLVRDLDGHESFLERLRIHRMQVKAMPLTEFNSAIIGTTKPEDLKASVLVALLGGHEKALRDKCSLLIDPYLKAIR